MSLNRKMKDSMIKMTLNLNNLFITNYISNSQHKRAHNYDNFP